LKFESINMAQKKFLVSEAAERDLISRKEEKGKRGDRVGIKNT